VEFQDVVRRRRMVRNFDGRPVPAETLDRILANAQRAPSAGFTQGWSFLVLRGTDETARYWDTVLPADRRRRFPWPGLLRAPVLIIALSDQQAYRDRYTERDKRRGRTDARAWPAPYWDIDTGFAVLLMLLTAGDAGLGALFFAVADIPAFRAAFGVPERYHPIGAIALGYPLPERRSSSLRRGRKPADSVIHRGRWHALE
jgi:nitroreductase